MSENQSKNKRAATRYAYVIEGVCTRDDQEFPCLLQDISVSGLQIQCEEDLDLSQQVFLVWEDPAEGKVEGVFYITRKFEKVDQVGKHYYGLRYYQMDEVSKQHVLNLLNGIKQQAKKETEKISLDAIYTVIDQGKDYIIEYISSVKELHAFFSTSLESLQAHEKKAFQGEYDPYSEVIQGLVVNYFHCALLKNIVPFVLQKNKRIPTLLDRVISLIEVGKELEAKEEAVFDYIKNKENEADLKMQYNQSTNRLFYGQQAMMEKVVKSLPSEALTPELQEKLQYIAKHYDYAIELTNPNIGVEDIHTVSKKPPQKKTPPKKEAKFNKKDSEFYVPDMEKKKGRGKVIFLVLMLLVIASFYTYQYVDGNQQTAKYQEELNGLPIPIKEAYREGSQLYVNFEADAWATLNDKNIELLRKQIKKYLEDDKWLRTAIIKASSPSIKMIITTLS